jgi:hypothetical protein
MGPRITPAAVAERASRVSCRDRDIEIKELASHRNLRHWFDPMAERRIAARRECGQDAFCERLRTAIDDATAREAADQIQDVADAH